MMPNELIPKPSRGTEISATALTLPDNLPYEKWVDYGLSLARGAETVMWALGDWWVYGEHRYGERAKIALESLPWALGSCRNAGMVARRFAETSRRRDIVPWSFHQEVAALDAGIADDLLDQAGRLNWSQRDLRQRVAMLRRTQRVEQITNADAAAEPSFNGQLFHVLYADPPWQYDYTPSESRAVENQYPTLTVDEISNLDVPAADDAVLFCWATSPKLREALHVIDAWGFDYRTSMIWVKDKIGMGYYARQQHELILIAARGELPTPAPKDRPSSVLNAPRLKHSAKPPAMYEIIERMYVGLFRAGSFVELFARDHRDGWVAWGNEIAATS